MIDKKIKNLAKNTLNKANEIAKEGTNIIKSGKNKATAVITSTSVDDMATKFTEFYSDVANMFLGAQVTIYDKAMDAKYIESKMGGMYHRLFDEGHDLFEAWDKVKNASIDDTFAQEVIGYTSAVTKDIVTKMGIPLKSIDKQTFDVVVDKFSVIPGVDQKYLYDLFTTNAAELTASSISSIGLIMAFKQDDYEKISEILGTMGVSAIMSANPILGIITVVTAGYAYKKEQLKSNKMAVGATVSAMAFAMFAILGLPFLVELSLVMLATKHAKKNLIENEQLQKYIKDKLNAIDHKEIIKIFKKKLISTTDITKNETT